jgi:hypothetical protein
VSLLISIEVLSGSLPNKYVAIKSLVNSFPVALKKYVVTYVSSSVSLEVCQLGISFGVA